MNLQLLEAVALKMVNEAITLAKTPEVQADAEDIVKKYLPEISPYFTNFVTGELKEIKSDKINSLIPMIFGFCSGFFAGACVLLFILANKAGLL